MSPFVWTGETNLQWKKSERDCRSGRNWQKMDTKEITGVMEILYFSSGEDKSVRTRQIVH